MARLTIPLDASGIEGFDPKQPVKVLLTSGGAPLASQAVTFDKKGQAQVAFDVDTARTGLRVVVGPPDATDEELTGLQTIGLDLPRRRFFGKDDLTIPAIRITPYYWFWWLRWCRTFTIHGRVLCPDGSPVPGAVVCAYDVDAWWWWWSKQQVGCATTDATGSFTLTFRWCCGWWPWWWWRLRRWYVEPRLAELIVGALQRDPRIPRIPLPDPAPDLSLFDRLVGEPSLPRSLGRSALAVQPRQFANAGNVTNVSGVRTPTLTRVTERAGVRSRAAVAPVEPTMLESLRERLVSKLPAIPALDALRLWPW